MPAKRGYEPTDKSEDPRSQIIGFKALGGRDDDILDWWEGIPQGQGGQVLRDLIRQYALGQEVEGSADNAAIVGELAALREMVEYMAQQMADGGFVAGPSKPRLSDDQVEMRRRNVKSSGW